MAVLQVVSQEMSNDSLVIRQHLEDLTTKSQIVVYESQEAILFKNGQALDLFGPGRHTLETANLPLIKRFFSGLFGGKTPFPCDIFFINKVKTLDFIWGTDSPIALSDPKYPMQIGVRANGQTGFRITDARRFIVNVAGMLPEYSVETIQRKVKGLMLAPIKESIAQAIDEEKVSILEITSRLTEISGIIEAKLNKALFDLGITIEHFNVNSITASDGDLDALKKAKAEMLAGMNQAEIEAYKMKVLSEARAKAREVEGFTYAEERRFDILEGAAKNESASGGLINMGVGFGVGAGVSREVSKMTTQMAAPEAAQPAPQAGGSAICAGCGSPIPDGAKFCMMCGQPRPTARFCPECGAKAQDGARFCMSCGTKLM